MKRILFVDDEPQLLNGLKRLIRGKRGEWDMHFADSGTAALDMMAATPFDVIVTDMRMPGMDGATLLSTVSKSSPGTARIVLSGFAEQNSVLRIVGPAHQYLAKPCDAAILTRAIERTLALRDRVANPAVQRIVGQIDALPVRPDVYSDLMTVLDNPLASWRNIAAIVERDLGLMADIWKLTNSAFFGLSGPSHSIDKAVQIIGAETLKSLALMSFFRVIADKHSDVIEQISRLRHRSLCIGLTAARLATELKLDSVEVEQARCAGTLAHLGSLLFMMHQSSAFRDAVAACESTGMFVTDSELQVLGSDHAQVGAYLLGLWGFGDPVVAAVACHHTPSLALDTGNLRLVAIVHVAQAAVRIERAAADVVGALDCDFMKASGFPIGPEECIDIAKSVLSTLQ